MKKHSGLISRNCMMENLFMLANNSLHCLKKVRHQSKVTSTQNCSLSITRATFISRFTPRDHPVFCHDAEVTCGVIHKWCYHIIFWGKVGFRISMSWLIHTPYLPLKWNLYIKLKFLAKKWKVIKKIILKFLHTKAIFF